ncbi:YtxH domain-containing protein [Clostridium algoriphilum]|uniref:YtxH domain-containing protein n=1 Tax=Clostridium algoriphilum TaxID=198347 RepID=UPI001CF42B3C|nr:YtxH domain-containing protein [Clostridium algoriphilum]MCB2293964.1 YtxH domain-containing protein [Clostridium algoriphilum]
MKFLNLFEKQKKAIQRKSKIKTAKKVLFGTAAGSLSGLLGGLLFSPKSGKETREDIVSSSKDLTNNIKEKTTELKETIDNKVTDVKESVTDAKVKISEYLNEKKPSKDTVSQNEDLSSIEGQTNIVDKNENNK